MEYYWKPPHICAKDHNLREINARKTRKTVSSDTFLQTCPLTMAPATVDVASRTYSNSWAAAESTYVLHGKYWQRHDGNQGRDTAVQRTCPREPVRLEATPHNTCKSTINLRSPRNTLRSIPWLPNWMYTEWCVTTTTAAAADLQL